MKKVLIIESPEIVQVMEWVLQEEGYKTIGLFNIVSLTEVMDINPDLIIVHERISKSFTGKQFIGHLKATPALAKIPTILTSISPDIKLLAQEAGSDTFLSKPFDLGMFSFLVKEQLEKAA